METIDLTKDWRSAGPLVGLFARFPPSVSGAASGAAVLAELLTKRFDIPVEVFRLVMPGEPSAGEAPVVMDLNPHWHMSAQLAAQRANHCDVAALIIDRHVPLARMAGLLSELTVPVVLWLDDVGVVEDPDTKILTELAAEAVRVVVPSEVARGRLETVAGRPLPVEVIPHGSSLAPTPPRQGPRGRLLTWGYVGRGMGAERVVRALALLGDLDPLPVYRLIGVTDSGWAQAEASSYRAQLMEEAESLGVAEQVEVVPILHSPEDLATEIEGCDLVVVPYDDNVRAASRILNEAVSAGRPVVATAFPGAIELLATGAGTTVAHDSDEDMASAIRHYLTDAESYERAARVGSALSLAMSWDETARQFALLINDVVAGSELIGDNSQ